MTGSALPATVGVIGIGAMGGVAAERFVAGGIAVYGPQRGRLDAFTAAGGTVLADAASVAQMGHPLILLLPNDSALASVMDEIARVLQRDQIVVVLGTHPVAVKRHAAALAAGMHAIVLDGEISGTPLMLREGKASIMLAGDETAVERVRPLLGSIVPNVTYVGPFGNAFAMKLITNYLVGVHTAAAAEALLYARRLGLDPVEVVDAIAPSAGSSTMFAVRGRMMAERRFPGGDMPSFVRYFDLLREALNAVDQSGGPILDLTVQLFRRAIDEGYGERDIAAICESFDR